MKKRVFLLLAALLILASAGALADVAISASNFPDANFRLYAIEHFDMDGDGSLSDAEITDAKSIDITGCNYFIQNYKGIEFFTSLEMLACPDSAVSSLNLSKNTRLRTLRCAKNGLTSLDLSQNTMLQSLDCRNNSLKKLDLSRNTALTSLACAGNSLTALDVSRNTKLTSMECGCNKLTSLDVSHNKELYEIRCEDNQISELDVSANPKLDSLVCSGNKLTSLDVSKNKLLDSLHFDNNQLTAIDLSHNPKLMHLTCASNRMKFLDLSHNPKLDMLQCQFNRFETLDVSKCPILADAARKCERKHHSNGYDYFDWDEWDDNDTGFTFDSAVTVKVGSFVSKPQPFEVTLKGLRYQADIKKETAVFLGPKDKNTKAITIPDTIKVNGKTCKVTEIKAKACQKLPKLEKVTIGKNVSKIGKNAFSGSNKIKTFIIRTTKLTAGNVGAGAFKTGYKKTTTVKCPKGKTEDYQKILVKKGMDKKKTKFIK